MRIEIAMDGKLRIRPSIKDGELLWVSHDLRPSESPILITFASNHDRSLAIQIIEHYRLSPEHVALPPQVRRTLLVSSRLGFQGLGVK